MTSAWTVLSWNTWCVPSLLLWYNRPKKRTQQRGCDSVVMATVKVHLDTYTGPARRVLERTLESNSGLFSLRLPDVKAAVLATIITGKTLQSSSEQSGVYLPVQELGLCVRAWLMESQKCWTSPPLSVRRWSLREHREAGGRAAIKTKAGRSGHVGRARSSAYVCEKPVYLPPWLWLSTESM